jgi:hypothetical protein
VSRSLAAYWEAQFFKDMARLRVREPDTLTRVTEYVPEIVSFVEGIIKNGYAYDVEGSVYFDTRSFGKAEGHFYAKLEPWSRGNRDLLEDGEGTSQSKMFSCLGHNSVLTRGPIHVYRAQVTFRLCPMEKVKTRRTSMAFPLGSWSSRMAY